MTTNPTKNVETFVNPEPERNYTIECDCPEFTCLCPVTGQPDFANVKITYIPNKLCVELKSLKHYLWSFRNEGAYHEKVTNQILNDLVYAIDPHWMEVGIVFNVRGGITTTVTAAHGVKPTEDKVGT